MDKHRTNCNGHPQNVTVKNPHVKVKQVNYLTSAIKRLKLTTDRKTLENPPQPNKTKQNMSTLRESPGFMEDLLKHTAPNRKTLTKKKNTTHINTHHTNKTKQKTQTCQKPKLETTIQGQPSRTCVKIRRQPWWLEGIRYPHKTPTQRYCKWYKRNTI